MKTFFLIIAICATAAVACPDDALNKKFANCLKHAKWTIEQYSSACSNRIKDAKFTDVLTCIYTAAEIVNTGNRGKVYVSPGNAAKLVTADKHGEVVQKFEACTRIYDTKSLASVTRDLYNCMYDNNYQQCYATCLSAIRGVDLTARS